MKESESTGLWFLLMIAAGCVLAFVVGWTVSGGLLVIFGLMGATAGPRTSGGGDASRRPRKTGGECRRRGTAFAGSSFQAEAAVPIGFERGD